MLSKLVRTRPAADLVPSHSSQFIKTNLSPAFFRLVSNILVATGLGRGGPTIGDRSAYAQRVVECWTRCLSVMIENDVVVSIV